MLGTEKLRDATLPVAWPWMLHPKSSDTGCRVAMRLNHDHPDTETPFGSVTSHRNAATKYRFILFY